jgi:hypothetical protein
LRRTNQRGRLIVMKNVPHFIRACLAATVFAMTLLTLTMPLTMWAISGTVTGEGFWPSFGAIVLMMPFVIVIGGIIALPLAALVGGAMLWWEARRGRLFSTSSWILAGLGAGLLTSAFVGTNDSDFARLVHIPWLASAGAMGAWVFARVWRRGA